MCSSLSQPELYLSCNP
ncbi:hypothetical protein VCHENC02_4582, partial [Vibrio harveyi]